MTGGMERRFFIFILMFFRWKMKRCIKKFPMTNVLGLLSVCAGCLKCVLVSVCVVFVRLLLQFGVLHCEVF